MKRILSAFFLCLCVSATANEIDTWSSPPETISTLGIDSSNPIVAMDPAGNVVGIWLEGSVLVSKTLPLNGSWSSSTTLSSTGASAPQLVVDAAGNATAIWLEGGVVKTATLPFNSTWSSATSLSAASSSSPQIAVDPSGNLVAVWVTSGVIQSKTRLFNMSWSITPDVLSGSNAAAPQVAIGANGTVVAAWHQLNAVTSFFNVNTAIKPIAGAWSVATLTSASMQNSVYPRVAVDKNGNAAAIWFIYSFFSNGNDFFGVTVKSTYRPVSTGTWTISLPISTAGAVDPAKLSSQLYFNASGLLIALWTNSIDGQTYNLYSAATNARQIWGSSAVIASSLYNYSFDVAFNSISDAFAIFMTNTPPDSSIIINIAESSIGGFQTGFWNAPVTISLGIENGFPSNAATLVLPTNCYAVGAWVNNNGSNNVIQSAFGTGDVTAPPSNIAVQQHSTNNGVFTEYYNVLSWTASTEPSLSSYIVYRNGHFIAFLDPSTMPLQIIDQNRGQNEAVVYGVSAIDSTGTESPIVTVNFP